MAEPMAGDSMDVRIARIEEQMKHLGTSLHDLRLQLVEDLLDLKRTVNAASSEVQHKQDDHARQDEERYVTKAEWYPVRNLIYGMVGLVGATLLGAVMAVLLGIKVVK